MISLIMIIVLIVSFIKPEALLTQEFKDRANEAQKKDFTICQRKLFVVCIVLFEGLGMFGSEALRGYAAIVTLIGIVLFFVLGVPAMKKNKQINEELGLTKKK